MSVMGEFEAEVRETIKFIRDTQAEYETWTDENEDLCGYDDETWYDTISEFDRELGNAAIRLADLLEKLMGDKA